MNAIELASDAVGGLPKLVGLLGCSYQQAYQWKTGERPVPPHFCPAIVEVSRGAVTLQQLRPDDWQRIWPQSAATEVKAAA